MKPLLILITMFPFLISSCRKEEKQETVITIRCVTPHNNQGIAGCKVIVYEVETKNDGSITGELNSEVINTYTGITDENGNATIRFHYKRKSKYQYKLSYDYSGIEQPPGMNEVEIITPQGWATYLDKGKFDYLFTFNVLGFCGVHKKFVNANCIDSSDEMQYEVYNLCRFESEDDIYSPTVYHGCGVVHESTSPSNDNLSTGIYVYKLKVIRNSETHIQYDTFNLQPGILNEMIIEY